MAFRSPPKTPASAFRRWAAAAASWAGRRGGATRSDSRWVVHSRSCRRVSEVSGRVCGRSMQVPDGPWTVWALAHPGGVLDEGEVGPCHLVEHDDAGEVGLGGDEAVQVFQRRCHARVVLGPHEVDVPGEHGELERSRRCGGPPGNRWLRRLDRAPEPVPEGVVLLWC
ncbi:hypothetical protein CHGG_07939 [Chaetomium globosum CBS 148.51]|uniref:Uncharacterized protein n=1 Tax=Chaetomium globosum (strain ATCC 6205 / CBS 148.51 / DSM 1962 / NBRC 6347 / NRRL 1970) TaxID=306901 RepID=Q2GVR5_CHAGB|nr:uncharacterized protein CHGG_07939 [Chaetomium globosum CBS 148.51]EAQ86686.1 hypothetical protein CHGG_07939 [Chaetomium globosum CBS 148.51]